MVHRNIYIDEHSEVPPNMKFCKPDNTILKDNILHLCLELNFVDIKTLKFPMCQAPARGLCTSCMPSLLNPPLPLKVQVFHHLAWLWWPVTMPASSPIAPAPSMPMPHQSLFASHPLHAGALPPLWVKVSDLGQTNNPNTTPIKGLWKEWVVVCLCGTRGDLLMRRGMLLHQRDDADADRGHSWQLGVINDEGGWRLELS